MSKIKVKSNKSAAKRYRITKKGKVVYNKKGMRHIMTKKSAKTKRKLGKPGILKSCEVKRIKVLIPYNA